jgi:hypothetical protein
MPMGPQWSSDEFAEQLSRLQSRALGLKAFTRRYRNTGERDPASRLRRAGLECGV